MIDLADSVKISPKMTRRASMGRFSSDRQPRLSSIVETLSYVEKLSSIFETLSCVETLYFPKMLFKFLHRNANLIRHISIFILLQMPRTQNICATGKIMSDCRYICGFLISWGVSVSVRLSTVS